MHQNSHTSATSSDSIVKAGKAHSKTFLHSLSISIMIKTTSMGDFGRHLNTIVQGREETTEEKEVYIYHLFSHHFLSPIKL